MRRLVLLTMAYPYGAGEAFLESEMEVYSSRFDDVVVLSTGVPHGKPVNAGSSVYSGVLNYDFSGFRKFAAVFETLFCVGVLKELFSFKWKTLGALKELLLFKAEGIQRGKALVEKIKKEKWDRDELYLCSTWMDCSAVAVSYAKGKLKIKKGVSRAHAWDIYFERNPNNYLPLREYLISNLDDIYFISEQGKRYYSEKFGGNDKFKVSRLGIKKLSEESISTITSENFLVSCSYIYPLKRIDLLIEALSKIEETNIRWIHIGDGFKDNDEEEIKELAKNLLEQKSNISYEFLGYLDNKEILKFYRANSVKCLVNLSTSEGIPVTFMEAFSEGVPVIATNVGGVSEIVDGNNGVLLAANPTSGEVKEAILGVLSMGEGRYSQLRKSAFDTWKLKYNSKLNTQNFIDDLLND